MGRTPTDVVNRNEHDRITLIGRWILHLGCQHVTSYWELHLAVISKYVWQNDITRVKCQLQIRPTPGRPGLPPVWSSVCIWSQSRKTLGSGAAIICYYDFTSSFTPGNTAQQELSKLWKWGKIKMSWLSSALPCFLIKHGSQGWQRGIVTAREKFKVCLPSDKRLILPVSLKMMF